MADEASRTTGNGVTLRDVGAAPFIKAYAAHLKNDTNMRLPKWSDVVKTGVGRELAPYDEDWYYIRAASIARKVYMRNGVGVGALRRIYGTAKNNGVRPEHFSLASGAIIRNILQALEAINVVEQSGRKGGRRISRTGQQALDRIAGQVAAAAERNVQVDEDEVESEADDE